MTKYLTYICIKKQKKVHCIWKFNLILENLSDQDKIGHLFMADLKFNEKLANEKVLLFTEIYTPLFEKKSELNRLKDLCSSCLYFHKETANACWKIFDNETEKVFVSQHWTFAFLNKTCFSKNLHLNSPNLKNDFVIMNQVSRENGEISVERDFYKLMNNANFGYDCRSNIDNCKITALYDEI